MLSVIVYTPLEGEGVHFGIPAEECVRIMSCGGAWDEMPPGFLDLQIERQIADGRIPDAARKFAYAVQFGGCTTKEAIAVIRDRDFGHLGRDFDLTDRSDLPADRWFRNAWHRTHNGGVGVDLEKAKPIQWAKVRGAVKAEEKRRETDLEMWSRPVDVPWLTVESAIRHAANEDELRRVWPL